MAGDNDDFRFDPVELIISGRADFGQPRLYPRQGYCHRDNLTETVSNAFPFQLIGASGDPLELGIKLRWWTPFTNFFPHTGHGGGYLKVDIVREEA